MPKTVNLGSFWNPEGCGQTVLPDMSVLIGQKLVENAKIKKIQMRHFEQFQTMMRWSFLPQWSHFWGGWEIG